MHACMHACMHTYMRTYMNTYIYILSYIHKPYISPQSSEELSQLLRASNLASHGEKASMGAWHRADSNIGALIIRTGFGGILYYNSPKTPSIQILPTLGSKVYK